MEPPQFHIVVDYELITKMYGPLKSITMKSEIREKLTSLMKSHSIHETMISYYPIEDVIAFRDSVNDCGMNIPLRAIFIIRGSIKPTFLKEIDSMIEYWSQLSPFSEPSILIVGDKNKVIENEEEEIMVRFPNSGVITLKKIISKEFQSDVVVNINKHTFHNGRHILLYTIDGNIKISFGNSSPLFKLPSNQQYCCIDGYDMIETPNKSMSSHTTKKVTSLMKSVNKSSIISIHVFNRMISKDDKVNWVIAGTIPEYPHDVFYRLKAVAEVVSPLPPVVSPLPPQSFQHDEIRDMIKEQAKQLIENTVREMFDGFRGSIVETIKEEISRTQSLSQSINYDKGLDQNPTIEYDYQYGSKMDSLELSSILIPQPPSIVIDASDLNPNLPEPVVIQPQPQPLPSIVVAEQYPNLPEPVVIQPQHSIVSINQDPIIAPSVIPNVINLNHAIPSQPPIIPLQPPIIPSQPPSFGNQYSVFQQPTNLKHSPFTLLPPFSQTNLNRSRSPSKPYVPSSLPQDMLLGLLNK